MDQSLVHDVGDNQNEYFRVLYSRTLNTLNTNYLLPVDQDEVKRSDVHHRLVQFLFSGRNYVGPVKEALQFGQQRRGTFSLDWQNISVLNRFSVLDLGTGCGIWAIETADEFPRAEVIAIDLAPIQPQRVFLPNNDPFYLTNTPCSSRHVPPNCTFELCDLDEAPIPYPDSFFDFIHARSLHIGIRDYPRFLREVARLLRPGGLVLLIEPTLNPCPPPAGQQPMHGWLTLWNTYRNCLRRQDIDVTVPERLSSLLSEAGAFESVIVREGNVPVGFWPQDPHSLSVGQLQWMDYELLIPALRPLFLCSGLPPSSVDLLIKDAQNNLYHPSYPLSTRLHIAYATKRFASP